MKKYFFAVLPLTALMMIPTASAKSTLSETVEQLELKLDAMKSKGEALSQESRQEMQTLINELKAEAKRNEKTLKNETAQLRTELKDKWGKRFASAFSELGDGFKRAWSELKGE